MINYFNIPEDVGYGSETQYQLGEIRFNVINGWI